jgi:hypothetical protein
VAWIAAATAVASLLVWNVSLQRRVADTDPSIDLGRVARLSAGAIVEMVGTGAPEASARMMIDADGRQAALVVTGLRPLPEDRVYQLWFARQGEKPVTGGAFRVNRRGEAAVVLAAPVPLAQARAIAITEEAAPRSLAPTGKHLLDLR